MTYFIGIASGKGGVGRTTIALNLAAALHRFGRNVILVDAHLSAPHIALQLGATKVPRTIHHVLNKKMSIRDAAYQHESGLQLIPGSILREHQENVHLGEIKSTLFDLLGTGEIVIIDMAAAGQEAFEVMRSCDHLLVVATPDIPSVTEALKTIERAKEFGVKIIGIVLNRVREKDDEITVANVETLTGTKVIAVIHENEDFKQALKKTQILVHSNPQSKASTEIKQLAARLIGANYERKHKK